MKQYLVYFRNHNSVIHRCFYARKAIAAESKDEARIKFREWSNAVRKIGVYGKPRDIKIVLWNPNDNKPVPYYKQYGI